MAGLDDEQAELAARVDDGAWERNERAAGGEMAALKRELAEARAEIESLNAKFKSAFETDHMISKDYVVVTRELREALEDDVRAVEGDDDDDDDMEPDFDSQRELHHD